MCMEHTLQKRNVNERQLQNNRQQHRTQKGLFGGRGAAHSVGMALQKNILFLVDFSERSRQLWPAVKRMAQELRAPVTLLHVIDTARVAPTELEGEQTGIRSENESLLRIGLLSNNSRSRFNSPRW